MITAWAIGVALIMATCAIHYEALRLISVLVAGSAHQLRLRVLAVVFGCFAAHLIEVVAYAGTYILLDRFGLGSLEGRLEHPIADYLYFSATSYSTLGIGDIYPIGATRLISGFEAINGLFLIAWSTSFTYLAMEQLWPLHSRIRNDDEDDRG